jgi:hypothetical protein
MRLYYRPTGCCRPISCGARLQASLTLPPYLLRGMIASGSSRSLAFRQVDGRRMFMWDAEMREEDVRIADDDVDC